MAPTRPMRKSVDPVGRHVFYPTPSPPNTKKLLPNRQVERTWSTAMSQNTLKPTSIPPQESLSSPLMAPPQLLSRKSSQSTAFRSNRGTPNRDALNLVSDNGTPYHLAIQPFGSATEYPFPTMVSSSPTEAIQRNSGDVNESPGLSTLMNNWNITTPPQHNGGLPESSGILPSMTMDSIASLQTEIRSPIDMTSTQGFVPQILPTTQSPNDLRKSISKKKEPREIAEDTNEYHARPPARPTGGSVSFDRSVRETSAGNRSPIPIRQPSWSAIRRGSVPNVPLHYSTSQSQLDSSRPPTGSIQPRSLPAPPTFTPAFPTSTIESPSKNTQSQAHDLFTPGYSMSSSKPMALNALGISLVGEVAPDRSDASSENSQYPSNYHIPAIRSRSRTQSMQSHDLVPTYNSNPNQSPPAANHDPSSQVSQVATKYLKDHILPFRFTSMYDLQCEIGSGGYGFVCTAVQTGCGNVKGLEVAVKFVIKAKLDQREDKLHQGEPMESWVLRKCNHENIVSWVDLIEDDKFYILIQELHGCPWEENHTLHDPNSAPPGSHTDPGHHQHLLQSYPTPPLHTSSLDLMHANIINNASPLKSPATPVSAVGDDGMVRPGMTRRASYDLFEAIESVKFTEEEVKWVFAQIVSAVSYLHSKGIYHRDLKDENIVMDSAYHVKIIDFGSAVVEESLHAPLSYSSFRGTKSYASPEILQGYWYHAAPVDIWCLGIILCILLTGSQPFNDSHMAVHGCFKLKRAISEDLKDLLSKIFKPDPSKRWTIEKIKRHPWLTKVTEPKSVKMAKLEIERIKEQKRKWMEYEERRRQELERKRYDDYMASIAQAQQAHYHYAHIHQAQMAQPQVYYVTGPHSHQPPPHGYPIHQPQPLQPMTQNKGKDKGKSKRPATISNGGRGQPVLMDRKAKAEYERRQKELIERARDTMLCATGKRDLWVRNGSGSASSTQDAPMSRSCSAEITLTPQDVVMELSPIIATAQVDPGPRRNGQMEWTVETKSKLPSAGLPFFGGLLGYGSE